jgi:hypothetical protein
MSTKLYNGNGKGFKISILLCLLILGSVAGAQTQQPQTFSSGSTGADGALDYSNLPAGTEVVFDPRKFNPPIDPAGDNIFNFTTINIPTGITVSLSGRILKGPVYWLASGDVTINGHIVLAGEDAPPPTPTLDGRTRAMPGPGGFSGGVGGKEDLSSPSTLAASPVAQPGDGPGGGLPNSVFGVNCGVSSPNTGGDGSFTGNPFLVPLTGGSGGAGGNISGSPLSETPYGAGGGAGGGAILIASSTSITVNGFINARGGNGGFPNCSGAGGRGSGGAIRLVAPSLTLGSNSVLYALGGFRGADASFGPSGAIRLESFTFNTPGFSLNNNCFSGTPFTLGSPFSTFVPATGPPSVAIASINGVNVSQPPTGNLATPDISINTTSPVQMTIQASFITPGTVITLHVFSDNNTDQTVQTTPLVGTLQSSTATANVTFPSGFSLQFVKATWTQ